MHRTEGANNVNGLFTEGPPPTTIDSGWLNSVQEEIANVIENAGITLKQRVTDTDKNQLWLAIESTIISFFGLHNFIINGSARIAQRTSAYALVKDTYDFGLVDRFEGMATGTLVTAGTFTQKTNSTLTRTGHSIHFSGVTLTGTGILYLRHRIESIDAKHFKNQIASFSSVILHDVGSSINYTVHIRKANVADDFSAVTLISSSAPQSIGSGSNEDLKFENVSMGDCSNGIEIEIQIDAGAITTKNFEIGELQLDLGTSAKAFQRRSVQEELTLCQRFYEAGRTEQSLWGTNALTNEVWHPFKVIKRVAPTVTGTFTTGGGSNVTTNQFNSSDVEGWQSRWEATVAGTDSTPFVSPWQADSEL